MSQTSNSKILIWCFKDKKDCLSRITELSDLIGDCKFTLKTKIEKFEDKEIVKEELIYG